MTPMFWFLFFLVLATLAGAIFLIFCVSIFAYLSFFIFSSFFFIFWAAFLVLVLAIRLDIFDFLLAQIFYSFLLFFDFCFSFEVNYPFIILERLRKEFVFILHITIRSGSFANIVRLHLIFVSVALRVIFFNFDRLLFFLFLADGKFSK